MARGLPQFLQGSDPYVRRDLESYPLCCGLDLVDQLYIHPDIETLLGHTRGYTKMMYCYQKIVISFLKHLPHRVLHDLRELFTHAKAVCVLLD